MKLVKFMAFLSLIILLLGTNYGFAQTGDKYLKTQKITRTEYMEEETIYYRANETRFFLNSRGLPETQQIRESNSEFIERIKERHQEKIRSERVDSPLWAGFLWVFGFIFTISVIIIACSTETGIEGYIKPFIYMFFLLGFSWLFIESSPTLFHGTCSAMIIMIIMSTIWFFIKPFTKS